MIFRIKQIAIQSLPVLDEHTLEVLTKSSSSMIVRVMGLVVGFAVSVILGRTIGANGLGIINLCNKVVSLLMIFVLLGMNNVVRKEVAIAYERNDWQHVADTIYTAIVINLPLAAGISVLALLITPWLTAVFFSEPELEIPLMIAFCTILPQTLSRVYAMGMNGFRKIWQSSLVNDSLSTVLIALGLLSLWLFEMEVTVVRVAILYGFGKLIVSIAASGYWKSLFSFSGKKELQTKVMLKVALPLLIVSATALIANSADTIMLGWLSSSEDVGLYNVAARLAMLTGFFYMISMSALSPKIASLFGEDKISELQCMVQRVSFMLTLIGIVSVVIFLAAGDLLLTVWGDEFTAAYWILIVLTIGQLFNIATGPAGMVLMMTGRENSLGYITLFSAILNVGLNYLLIQSFGAIGVAFATSITLISQNMAQVIMVKYTLGISTIGFPKFA